MEKFYTLYPLAQKFLCFLYNSTIFSLVIVAQIVTSRSAVLLVAADGTACCL